MELLHEPDIMSPSDEVVRKFDQACSAWVSRPPCCSVARTSPAVTSSPSETISSPMVPLVMGTTSVAPEDSSVPMADTCELISPLATTSTLTPATLLPAQPEAFRPMARGTAIIARMMIQAFFLNMDFLLDIVAGQPRAYLLPGVR